VTSFKLSLDHFAIVNQVGEISNFLARRVFANSDDIELQRFGSSQQPAFVSEVQWLIDVDVFADKSLLLANNFGPASV